MNHDRRPARTTLRVTPQAGPTAVARPADESGPIEADALPESPPRRRPTPAAVLSFLVPAALGAGLVAMIAQNVVPSVRVTYPATGEVKGDR